MAKFQQRHYETIAQAIQDEKASYVTEGASIRIGALQSFAESLAGIFAGDNPHFDCHRFLKALRAWGERAVAAQCRPRYALQEGVAMSYLYPSRAEKWLTGGLLLAIAAGMGFVWAVLITLGG